jgi:hypothetical protein
MSDRLHIGRMIHHAEADLEEARRLVARARALLRGGSLSRRIEAGGMLVRLWWIAARGRLYLAVLRLMDTRGR